MNFILFLSQYKKEKYRSNIIPYKYQISGYKYKTFNICKLMDGRLVSLSSYIQILFTISLKNTLM